MISLVVTVFTFPDLSRFVYELMQNNMTLEGFLKSMNVTDVNDLMDRY